MQEKAHQIQHFFVSRPVTEQLQSFFASQRLLYTAVRGEHDRLWASVLFGKPSFVQVPTGCKAVIDPLQQFEGDPARYQTGTSIGTVGVMFENRRRNLLNGVITNSASGKLQIDVYQALGNCPKYIQVRQLVSAASEPGGASHKSGAATRGQAELQTTQLNLIARSDTFFIASVHLDAPAESGNMVGCQLNHINHKGGYPGFVQADRSGRLCWGDYAGNNALSTLGNLVLDPEAALLFIDFTTGDTLHLSGHAETQWEAAELPGAQRAVVFQTEAWVHVKAALPIQQQGPVESSPYNPTPPVSAGNPQASTLQRLKCLSTQRASMDVMTFEFELPQLPANKTTFCRPGQFASFDFDDITSGQVLNRTWTISSPGEQIQRRRAFTISVKKDGLVSSWLFDNMSPGKTIGFKGVDGDFTLELTKGIAHSRVLLVAGGIGITPMRVLLAERLALRQPVSLLYFVRSVAEAPFLEEFAEAAQSSQGLFACAVSVTRLAESEAALNARPGLGVTWLQGRATADMILQVCPDVRSSLVFQCGPTPMTQLISAILENMQVPAAHVFQETFSF